jgi:hypothetical protein
MQPDVIVDNGLIMSDQIYDRIRQGQMMGLEAVWPLALTRVVHEARNLISNPAQYVYGVPARPDYLINFDKSRVKQSRRDECARCLGATYQAGTRLVLEPGPWQQYDVFTIDAIPGKIILSQRAAHLLASERLPYTRVLPTQMIRLADA